MIVTISFVHAKNDLLSDLIRIRSPLVSHAEFVLPDGSIKDGHNVGGWRLGAHFNGGVQLRKPDYQVNDTEWRATLPCDRSDDLYKEALCHIGEPYDWKAIAGFLVPEPLHEYGHAICSAFIAMITKKYVPIKHLPQPDYKIDPYDWLLVCSQVGTIQQVI